MNVLDIEQHPEIVACNERIRMKQGAVQRAKEALTEEARKKVALVAVQKEEERLEAAREERRQTVQKLRAEAVAKLKPKFDAAARDAHAKTLAAHEAHARLAVLHEQARQANGSRAPLPALHMPELLASTASQTTRYSNWWREIDAYVESLPAPKQRKRLADAAGGATGSRRRKS